MTTTAEPEIIEVDVDSPRVADPPELIDAEAVEDTADVASVEPGVSLDRVDAAMEAFHAGDDAPERVELLPALDRWAQMEAMAKRLAHAPTMPAHIRQSKDPEADMMVVLLAAHDLGLSTTTALQKIHVIDGRPTMAAELMRMLIRRDKHDLWQEVQRDDDGRPLAVTWYGIRHDDPKERVHEGRYSLEDARVANLVNKDNWKKNPEDMLSARATARLARKGFEDCLAGVSYTPDEITIVENEDEQTAPRRGPTERGSSEHVEPSVRASFKKRIEDLPDPEKQIVYRLWRERGLGSLLPDAKSPLRKDQMHAMNEVLAEAKRDAPSDAELVTEPPANLGPHAFQGSATATECATCGNDRAHELHPVDACPGCEHPWAEHDLPGSLGPDSVGAEGCNHLDPNPEDPTGEGIACMCALPRPVPAASTETAPVGAVADGDAVEGALPDPVDQSCPVCGVTPGVRHLDDCTEPARIDRERVQLATLRAAHEEAVAKMDPKAVHERLERWGLPAQQTVTGARAALVRAMLDRKKCDDCGKLQTGPGRKDEARCACPF